MKELSIEQKAKAYDEALKVLHKYDGAHIMFTQDLKEEMFPELKESDDEKVRRVLREIVLQWKNGHQAWCSDDKEMGTILAWIEKQADTQKKIDHAYAKGLADAQKALEKQCEKKPTLPKWKYKNDNIPLLRDSIILNKYGCVAKSPSGALVDDVWVLDYDELAKLPKEEIEKQGERKPVDNGESNLLTVERAKEMSPFMMSSFENESAAWSEEDEVKINRIVACLENLNVADNDILLKDVDWLKSLKDRVQPKQEWSEEDSRILYNVKAYIGYAAGQRGVKYELFKEANEWLNSLPIGFIYNKNYNEDMVTLLVGELKQIANDNNAPEQYKAEINWLKSLRPQNIWRPSDEQINALAKNVEYVNVGCTQSILKALLEDLKKLMEE